MKTSKDAIKKEVKENAGTTKTQRAAIDSKVAKLEQQGSSLWPPLQAEGKGEITVFFPFGRNSLDERSAEYNRLVAFVDYLSRESKNRKVFFKVIGSSSALRSPAGKRDYNRKLSELRADFVRNLIDGYLVNIPHEFSQVYGIGDSESPTTKDRTGNETHRSVRIFATFGANLITQSQEQLLSPDSSNPFPQYSPSHRNS